jgi:hypothetical protein
MSNIVKIKTYRGYGETQIHDPSFEYIGTGNVYFKLTSVGNPYNSNIEGLFKADGSLGYFNFGYWVQDNYIAFTIERPCYLYCHGCSYKGDNRGASVRLYTQRSDVNDYLEQLDMTGGREIKFETLLQPGTEYIIAGGSNNWSGYPDMCLYRMYFMKA